MLLRRLSALAVALAVAGPAAAEEPRPLRMDSSAANQQLADAVASELRASGQLRGYRIDVTCSAGVIELNGTVADADQQTAAARMAQAVPGVTQVVNKLQPRDGGITRTKMVQDKPVEPLPAPMGHGPAPTTQEPLPSYRSGMPYSTGALPPPMPANAWPTYAPYNNASRVAYPTVYPYEAFPHVGPFYPFPKVPLGWRKVTLEWDDGHWYLQTHAQKRDWWSVRFW
jgi:hypothetical protein